MNNIIRFLCKYNYDDINIFIKEEQIDMNFLIVLLGLLRNYEKCLLKNKYLYYNREEFWWQQMLLMIIMYKHDFDNMEQYMICTFDRIIKNMFQDNSIIMIYPEYLKDGKIKKRIREFIYGRIGKKIS